MGASCCCWSYFSALPGSDSEEEEDDGEKIPNLVRDEFDDPSHHSRPSTLAVSVRAWMLLCLYGHPPPQLRATLLVSMGPSAGLELHTRRRTLCDIVKAKTLSGRGFSSPHHQRAFTLPDCLATVRTDSRTLHATASTQVHYASPPPQGL